MWLTKSQLCFSQISFMEVMSSRDQYNQLMWPSPVCRLYLKRWIKAHFIENHFSKTGGCYELTASDKLIQCLMTFTARKLYAILRNKAVVFFPPFIFSFQLLDILVFLPARLKNPPLCEQTLCLWIRSLKHSVSTL